MALLRIQEQTPKQSSSETPNAKLVIDSEEFLITITNPFTAKEERELTWYFEKHIEAPHLNKIRARDAARSITTYGEALFKQVFADPEALVKYREHTSNGLDALQIEIAGSPAFHALHWEALKDPKYPHPFSHRSTIVRKNITPSITKAKLRPSSTINLLVVVAQPFGRRDVNYRTFTRPLVETLRQIDLPVNIDIIRPGTYKALVEHLEQTRQRQNGEDSAGYYHVIHFDMHGAVLSYKDIERGHKANQFMYNPYGRRELTSYKGTKAFLFFEGKEEGQADPSDLSRLLVNYKIPIAILDSCQSAQVTGQAEREGKKGKGKEKA